MTTKSLARIRKEKADFLAKLEAQEKEAEAKRRDQLGRLAASVGALELEDAIIKGALKMAVEDEAMRARFREAGKRKSGKRSKSSDGKNAASSAADKKPETPSTDKPAAGSTSVFGRTN